MESRYILMAIIVSSNLSSHESKMIAYHAPTEVTLPPRTAINASYTTAQSSALRDQLGDADIETRASAVIRIVRANQVTLVDDDGVGPLQWFALQNDQEALEWVIQISRNLDRDVPYPPNKGQRSPFLMAHSNEYFQLAIKFLEFYPCEASEDAAESLSTYELEELKQYGLTDEQHQIINRIKKAISRKQSIESAIKLQVLGR